MSFGGYLKADTETKVTIGPVVAVANGYVPVTNLALDTADEAEIIKHNGNSVTDISAGTMAAIANADGYYALTMAAGYLDTEGRITVLLNDDNLCLPVRMDFEVVNTNVYDSLFAAATTDYLQTDVVQWLSQACHAVSENGVPKVDLDQIGGTADPAAKLKLSLDTMVTGTVSWDNTNASTTAIYSDDITEATADHYKGRLITFTSGDLIGQYTDITAYALDTGEGKFTVTALTEAPADNVTFIII